MYLVYGSKSIESLMSGKTCMAAWAWRWLIHPHIGMREKEKWENTKSTPANTSSTNAVPPKVSYLPQIASPTVDQVLWYINLSGTFLIQETHTYYGQFCKQRYAMKVLLKWSSRISRLKMRVLKSSYLDLNTEITSIWAVGNWFDLSEPVSFVQCYPSWHSRA